MNDHVVIRIPTAIDRALTPNGRAHWRKRHRLSQDLKNATILSVRTNYLDVYPDAPWRLDYVVARKRNAKPMDDDNIKASLKYVQDGIAAETGINDKHMQIGTVEQIRDPEGLGYIEVRISNLEAA